jgi:ribosome recycling factor
MARDDAPNSDDILLDVEERMDKAVRHLEEELRKIRSGRATPGLVENIRVEYYGAPTPLNQLATISIPEPRLIVIKPFDKSCLGDIEKSVLKSDIGLTPNNDGKLIRLTVPPLSEERRKQLVQQVKKMAEAQRVAVRNVRRDVNKEVEGHQKKSHFTEDERDKLLDQIQESTKEHEKKIDDLVDRKSKEILEV